MSPTSFYIGILPDGTLLQGGATPESATSKVKATGFDGTIVVDEVPPTENEGRAAPEAGDRFVRLAVARSGLRPVTKQEVMALTPEQAVERLYPVLRHLKTQWVEKRSPLKWADELMGDNSKLVKDTTNSASPVSETTKRAGYLIGLNLFPADKLVKVVPEKYATHPFAAIITQAKSGELVSTSRGLGLPAIMRDNLTAAFQTTGWTLCAGSSAFCRNACLVFTGKNALGGVNDWKKAGLALAMLADPVAYFRLLVLSVERGVKEAAKQDTVFFARMNLLSDIPWEELVPWLFKMFPTVKFYDYTKVYGRDPLGRHGIKNYDLTFSFSGTNKNLVTRSLYEDNRRVAVVFLGYKTSKGRLVPFRKVAGETKAGKTIPYGFGIVSETDMFAPPELQGTPAGMRKVITGDSHDARPLDPPNRIQREAVITGLIWKTPMGTPMDKRTEAQDSAFVTKTYFVPAKKTKGVKRADFEGTFRLNPGEEIEGFLVVAETPRYEGLGETAASLTVGE
jgi:hypothetical protein